MKALALDDALSTAHWAFGWATWVNDWDLDKCEAAMRRALQLNPSDEHAHLAIPIFLIATSDDQARAVSEMKLALHLDPLSEYVNACLAWIYLFVDDYDRAVEQARRTLELFPGSPIGYAALGLAELCRCRYAEAIEIFEKAVAISNDALSMACLASALRGRETWMSCPTFWRTCGRGAKVTPWCPGASSSSTPRLANETGHSTGSTEHTRRMIHTFSFCG